MTLSAFSPFAGPEHRITARAQVVMWFAGMRGAVSFALAITLPASAATAAASSGKDVGAWSIPMVTTTLGIVLITNLLMAPLTGPLIRSLDLVADDERCASRTASGVLDSGSIQNVSLNNLLRDAAPRQQPPLARAWRLVDDHYLKPYLGGRVHKRSRAGSVRSQTFDPNALTPSSTRASMAGQPTEGQPRAQQADGESSSVESEDDD